MDSREHRFDRLAKSVAGAMSRREAFWRVGGGLLAGVLAIAGLAADDDKDPSKGHCMSFCAVCCKNVAPPPRGHAMAECITQCHDGEGVCGPAFIFEGCLTR